MCLCPTENCQTKSKLMYIIVKHSKKCSNMKTKKKEREASKKCKCYSNIFAKRSSALRPMRLDKEDDASSPVREDIML